MTVVSIIILFGYIILHVFSILQTRSCLHVLLRRTKANLVLGWILVIAYIGVSVLPIFGTYWPEGALKYRVMEVGNLTLGFDIYYCGFLLLFTLAQGIVVLIKKKKFTIIQQKTVWTMFLSIMLAILLPIYGMVHAQRPVATYWKADITSGAEAKGEYRVVLLGDLHMSVNSHPALYRKMTELVNEQNADAVFIAGDFFTSNYEGLKNPELYISELSKLSAKEGVFAVYGNHDVKEGLFCGFSISPTEDAFRQPEMVKFVEACGFRMLEDEVIEIAGGDLILAGRKDADKAGDGTNNRLSSEELLAGLGHERPVLVLEHEPNEYNDLSKTEADMVFSGHTHNGQIWPCNIFVQFMTKNAYGQKNIKGLETFVTSGVGYFGPPQRSGTVSEVMVIDITY